MAGASDEEPLCCCEYWNRRGERAHFLGCCCECEALDQTADALISGRRPAADKLDEVLAELDDRLRLPTPGGAWHIGLPRAVPWALLPLLLLIGSLSACCLLLAAAALLPSIFWWHSRTIRLRHRSQFLLSWQLASLTCEATVIFLLLPSDRGGSTLSFGAAAIASLVLLARCKLCNVSSTAGVADSVGATSRAVVCPVSGLWVPRYDHYCAWVDEPIGAANHRPFLAFLVAMILTCVLGMHALLRLRPGSASWFEMIRDNRSSLFLACFVYGGAVGACVVGLLAHQLWLLARGTTTYEDRRRRRQPARLVGATACDCSVRLREFCNQTAPLLGRHRHAAHRAGSDKMLRTIQEAADPAAEGRFTSMAIAKAMTE